MQNLVGQPSLFPDLDYHSPDADGFFALLTVAEQAEASPVERYHVLGGVTPNKEPSQRREMRQECFPNRLIRDVLGGLDTSRTTYIGQAEHFARNRRAVTVARIGVSFVDLDTYKSNIAHLKEREVVDVIRSRCDENRIPEPSLIVSSGRGYYAKWLYEKPLPRKGLTRWNAVQERLVSGLSDIGADPQARDVSRVLRVVGTTNEKTGEKVKIIWSNDVDGAPVRYGFDALAEETLDLLRVSHHERKDAPEVGRIVRTDKQRQALLAHTFTKQSLWWARLEDLRTLAALRGYRNGLPEGQRDLFLFLSATALGWCVSPNALYREIAALGREFAPTLGRNAWYSYTSSTFARVKASWADGDTEERYRYTNRRLIELLKLTPDEMLHLSTLIDSTELGRRHRERQKTARRAAGSVSRDTFLVRAAERASEAKRMASEGFSQRQIAEHLGVTQARVSQMVSG